MTWPAHVLWGASKN